MSDGREADLARDLAIDLGTANTLVYARGEGIVLNEPSVIALNDRSGTVLEFGRDAWRMIGRTPSYIVAAPVAAAAPSPTSRSPRR
ncbi:MAG: rod shape-determining protein [Microthrixaceae bacterium]